MSGEMDSDSDDNLEDVSFLSAPAKSTYNASVSAIKRKECLASSIAETSNKLDVLLSEHRREVEKTERLQKLKEIEINLSLDPSQNTSDQVETTIGPELSKVIEDLNVKNTDLPDQHPTLRIFSPETFGCLFGDNVHPFTWAFSPSQSDIDTLVANITPDALNNFLLSEVLPFCFHNVSCSQEVMAWLLSIVSIHSCDLTMEASSTNVISILRRLNVFKVAHKTSKTWSCPHPLQLLAVFVNMGANPSDLLVDQNLYTDERIRSYLAGFVRKTDPDQIQKPCGGCVRLSNCRKFFDLLARCLQSRPGYCKDELNAILFMVMKVSVDDTFKDLDLQRQFQVCISSVLECYTDEDWPGVVPELCRQINSIPHHHHTAVYLTELLPFGDRGRYLQIRLSFLMLCTLLEAEQENIILNLELPNISLSSIAELGDSKTEPGCSSKLAVALKSLIKDDVYKMRSILLLLDRAVGDETNRSQQPKEEIDFLVCQLKEVIKGIRDSVFGLNLSRIKDMMSNMTFKWMSVSSHGSKYVQRSIFPWITATSHAPVKEVVLEDSMAQSSEEEDMPEES